ALQEGSRHRLALRLGLPATVGTDELVDAVATAVDQPRTVVHRLLTDPTAPDDATLVDVARRLRSLEEGTPAWLPHRPRPTRPGTRTPPAPTGLRPTTPGPRSRRSAPRSPAPSSARTRPS